MERVAGVVALLLVTTGTGVTHPLNMQGVIVHLFEWTYPDIALECEEFLAPRGFAGIQISPPSENLVVDERPWWERYQPVSYLLVTRSGNEQQLTDMLARCNKVGVRVFADAVINHMTGSSAKCQGTAGSKCDPQALSYPAVPYTRDHFHQPACSMNNNNASEVRNCELVGLHDLNQSLEYVQQKIVGFLNHLIDIGIAGFRVDAAKHMNPADLTVIYSRLKNLNTAHGFPANTKPFIYQEVVDMGQSEAVRYNEYTGLGRVTDFRFGGELGRCFQGRNDLRWLNNFGLAWNLLPGNESIVFIENHDTERGDNADVLNFKKSRSYKMAVAFMLSWGYGLPKLLSSYHFSQFNQGPPQDSASRTLSARPAEGGVCGQGWVCQHRWRQIYNMVAFYNVVLDTEVKSWWDNGKNQIAFCRGNKGFIAFNLENYTLNQTLQTCLPKGSYCDIISGSWGDKQCMGKTVHVGEDGRAQVIIGKFDTNSPDDGVLAIHINARI